VRCDFFWGSHGCDKPAGHVESGDTIHECGIGEITSETTFFDESVHSRYDEKTGEVTNAEFGDGPLESSKFIGWSELYHSPYGFYGDDRIPLYKQGAQSGNEATD
jgi:hypothetical protein